MIDLSSKRLASGGVFQLAGYFLVSVVLPFVLTPLILRSVGPEQFGVWAILMSLASWLNYTDIGLSQGLPRVVGELGVRERREELGALVRAILSCFGAGLVGVLGLAWLGSDWIFSTFVDVRTPSHRLLVTGVIALFAIRLGCRILTTALSGLQRSDRAATVSIVAGGAQLAGVLWVVAGGRGLAALATILTATAALQLGGLVYHLRDVLRASRGRLRAGPVVAVARVGFVLYLTQLLAHVFQLDRVYFGWLRVPAEEIASYHLAVVLVSSIGSLLATLGVVIYPAAASFKQVDDAERLGELAFRTTKYLTLAGTFLFGFLTLFAPHILVFWLGEPAPATVPFVRVLALWGYTAIIGGLTAVAAGVGRAGLQLKSSILSLVVAVPLFLLLGLKHGPLGVAWTISLSVFTVMLVYIWDFVRRVLPGSLPRLLRRSFLKPMFAAAAGLLPVYGLLLLAQSRTDWPETRWHALGLLLVCFLVAGATTALSTYVLRLFDEKDWRAIS